MNRVLKSKIKKVLNSSFLYFVFIIIYFVSPIHSQTADNKNIKAPFAPIRIQNNSTGALSEQEVIDLAFKNSTRLQLLETNEEIANYRYNSSGWIENPELRISDVSTRYFTDKFEEIRVGLRWDFPKLGELGEEEQQAFVKMWERKVAKIRFHDLIIARVRRSYADVLKFDQRVELAQKRVKLEDERIRIIEELVKLGSRSIVYFTKAKMWHAESKNDSTRAIQSQGEARRLLAKRSGVPENSPLVIGDLPEIDLELEQLVNIGYKNRPEITLVDQRIELSIKQKNLEYFKLIPWPTFVDFSYHREKKRKNDWGEFMIGINLPLFNWNRGNMKATDLAVKKKQDESDAIRESIEEEIRSAYIIYEDLLLDWKNSKINSENLIQDATQVILMAKEHNTLMPDEVFEMELTILDAKKLLGEKRCNLAHALSDLYYAMGIDEYQQLYK